MEVIREMKKAKKAVRKVTWEGQKRFLRFKCLFTASTAPVMWLRCLPEDTVWQPFMEDENGEYRRDANHGRHYSPVSSVVL